jgi:hypothetical protein
MIPGEGSYFEARDEFSGEKLRKKREWISLITVGEARGKRFLKRHHTK